MSKPFYKRLGDIVNFKRGYDLPHHARQEGLYPVISSGGVSGYHAVYKASGEGLVTGRYGTLGEVHYVTGNYWPHNTALYVTDFKGNYPKYVYFLMKCLGNLQTADKSTVPGINRNDLHEVKVPYHKPSEQKAIADLLWILEDKIALNTRINAELEAMAKLLYDYWFVQFDFPNAKGKPYKSSGGAMVHNAELKREVPKGWEVTDLRKYIKSNRGHSYTSAGIGSGGRPMINLNSFNTNSTYKVEGLKLYSGVLNHSKVLKPFDLVMCNTQQTALDPVKDIIGKSLLVPDIFDKEIVSSHHVTTIDVKKEDLKCYLNSLFNSDYFHRYISGYCSGTNILGLDFEGVLSFRTAIPSDGLLESFGAFVRNIEQRKSISLKENQELTTLRDWLLPMLMNGQVRVSTVLDVTKAPGNEVPLSIAAEPQSSYGLKIVHRKLTMEDRAALNAWVVEKSRRDHRLGRVKAEKIEHLLEGHIQHDHQREALRDAAGPVDFKSRLAVEKLMVAKDWAVVEEKELKSGHTMYHYHSGPQVAVAVAHAEALLGASLSEAERLVALMRPLKTERCEVVATLYAAWNDLLHHNKPTKDKDIIYAASYDWHADKADIEHCEWEWGLGWLRENVIVPTGKAKQVKAKKGK